MTIQVYEICLGAIVVLLLVLGIIIRPAAPRRGAIGPRNASPFSNGFFK